MPVSMKMVHIDDPTELLLVDAVTPVNGWIAYPCLLAPRLQHRINTKHQSTSVRVSFYQRPDLDPNVAVGFTAYFDLRTLLEVDAISLYMGLDRPGGFSVDFRVHADAWLKCDMSRSWNARKQAHIQSILKQPSPAVAEAFSAGLPYNALPGDWRLDYRIESKNDPVSSHYYGPKILNFLEQLPPDGMVLDIGAGLRRIPWPNVINCEIYDYPSTDVLCLGSELPFADNSVDAVLSLAVLEHVPNPFLCAAEIQRVLNPGGKAYVMIPFLQAEHGYPSHYFNATRQGVLELFSGLRCLEQYIDTSNHPIMTCAQVLSIYLETIPPEKREQWLAMPLRDVFSLASSLDDVSIDVNPLLRLTEDSWKIAWGTTSLFQKV